MQHTEPLTDMHQTPSHIPCMWERIWQQTRSLSPQTPRRKTFQTRFSLLKASTSSKTKILHSNWQQKQSTYFTSLQLQLLLCESEDRRFQGISGESIGLVLSLFFPIQVRSCGRKVHEKAAEGEIVEQSSGCWGLRTRGKNPRRVVDSVNST